MFHTLKSFLTILCRHAAVEAELFVRRLDQFLLGGTDLVDDLGNILRITVLIGQLQIPLKMPRLAFQQAKVELAEFFVQMRHQRFEPLATARFDKRADHQRIHQFTGSWLRTTLRKPDA